MKISRYIPLLCLSVVLTGAQSVSANTPSQPVDFVNDIIPILTKNGCNAGTCHAKAGGGQNGFQLSLLGFEPDEDYESIVVEVRGRRLFPAAPSKSLLLQKATASVPHGGGRLIDEDSKHFHVLQAWVSQGAPFRSDGSPELVSISVEPESGIIPQGSSLQLKATATYDDGTIRDVTDLALYESNASAMVEADSKGHVKVSQIPGNAAIMVRYQGLAATFTASIPLGASVEKYPDPNNFVDELVFDNLKTLGIPTSEVCDDATFLRRASLDIAGRIPSEAEVEEFLASNDPAKRSAAIDRLLQSPEYADFFANKWTSLLKNRRDQASDITSNFAFHAWIRDSMLANVPYDELVRQLLGATGTVIDNPPVAWYKRVKEPKDQLEDVAQLFLGVRLQCAQCHHHPFEKWSQDDYYSLSAFFSRVGRKPTGVRGEDFIFHERGMAEAKNVKSGEMLPPQALGDDLGSITPDQDPRLKLADWMSDPQNPFFAKALVNRYWKHFFNLGLIEPEDDIRDTNPPTNPKLLAALERHFVESGFDLKDLVRVITNSKAYQLSSQPNEHNVIDKQNFSRYYPRRMQAEVMLDAIDDVTGTQTSFANLPPGTSAVGLPDNSYNKSSAFLRVFGRPNNSSVCECERVQSSSLGQSLHMLNSSEIKSKLTASNGTAMQFSKSEESIEQNVRRLYLTAFARSPREDEMEIATTYLKEPILDESGNPKDEGKATQQKWADLVWALLNTKEFLFNH